MNKYKVESIRINGIDVSYFDEGAHENNTVVFLHGWSGSKDKFCALIETLDPYFRIVILDLPGHGDSEPLAKGNRSLCSYSMFVRDFLQQLGITKANLIGFSMGGTIALMCSSFFPDFVDKIVVWESFTNLTEVKKFYPASLLFKLLQERPSLCTQFHTAVNRKFISGILSCFMSSQVIVSVQKADIETLVDVGARLIDTNFQEQINGSEKVALLVCGRKKDLIIPKQMMQKLKSVLPKAEIREVEGAEHFATNRNEVYAEVLKFLQNNNANVFQYSNRNID